MAVSIQEKTGSWIEISPFHGILGYKYTEQYDGYTSYLRGTVSLDYDALKFADYDENTLFTIKLSNSPDGDIFNEVYTHENITVEETESGVYRAYAYPLDAEWRDDPVPDKDAVFLLYWGEVDGEQEGEKVKVAELVFPYPPETVDFEIITEEITRTFEKTKTLNKKYLPDLKLEDLKDVFEDESSAIEVTSFTINIDSEGNVTADSDNIINYTDNISEVDGKYTLYFDSDDSAPQEFFDAIIDKDIIVTFDDIIIQGHLTEGEIIRYEDEVRTIGINTDYGFSFNMESSEPMEEGSYPCKIFIGDSFSKSVIKAKYLPDAPSYDDLKNKPFWTDETVRDFCSFTVVLSDTNNPHVADLELNPYYSCGFYYWDNLNLESGVTIQNNPVYKTRSQSLSKDWAWIYLSRNLENLVFEIEYDGTAYTAKPYLIISAGTSDYYGLGSFPTIEGDSTAPEDAQIAVEQENFPFYIEIEKKHPDVEPPISSDNGYVVNFYIIKDDIDHTFSVKTTEFNIHKIEEKYLPEFNSDVEAISGEELATMLSYDINIVGADFAAPGWPNPGTSYKYITDGIYYLEISQLDEDDEATETKTGKADIVAGKFYWVNTSTGEETEVQDVLTDISGSCNDDEWLTFNIHYKLFGIPIYIPSQGIAYYK